MSCHYRNLCAAVCAIVLTFGVFVGATPVLAAGGADCGAAGGNCGDETLCANVPGTENLGQFDCGELGATYICCKSPTKVNQSNSSAPGAKAAVPSGFGGYEAVRAKYGFQDPLGGTTVPTLVGRIIAQALPIVGALFLLAFIYSGFLWLTAGGESKKVDEAIKTMRNAVIGIAIVVCAYMILTVVLNVGSTVMSSASTNQATVTK